MSANRDKKLAAKKAKRKAEKKLTAKTPIRKKAQFTAGRRITKTMDLQDGILAAVPHMRTPEAPRGSGTPAKAQALRTISNLAPKDQDEPLAAIPATEEEKAIVKSKACAAQLLQKEEYRVLMGCIIAFRRLYSVAYRQLQSLLAKEPEGSVHSQTEDYLLQAAMHAAANPFTETQLMEGVVETVLPWVGSVVDTHIAEDAKEEHDAQLEDEKARRARRVAIGFRVDMESEDDCIGRDRTLVLVGWKNAVNYVLDQVVNAALVSRDTDKLQVIRFVQEFRAGSSEANRYYLRLAPNVWKGKANTKADLAVMAGEHIQDAAAQFPDLLVVDSLGDCFTAGYTGRPQEANAGDAHKVLRYWCTGVGSALVCGLPMESREHPDLRVPQLEQLRTFADTRQVRVYDIEEGLEEGKYRIRVGTGLHFFDVDKAVLDGYSRGNLILPAGV